MVTRKSLLKMAVDAAILVLMLSLISYPLTRGLWRHAMMGCSFAALFLVHQSLNLWWFKGLAEGPWKLRRFVHSAVSLALVANVLVLVTSAVLLAGEVFSFAAFPMTNWARSLHVTATAWAIVLASFHLGMHGEGFWQWYKAHFGAYRYCFFFVVMVVGVVNLIESGMIWDLLHEDEMPMLPETLWEFVGIRLSVVVLFCIAGRLVTELLQAQARRARKRNRPNRAGPSTQSSRTQDDAQVLAGFNSNRPAVELVEATLTDYLQQRNDLPKEA